MNPGRLEVEHRKRSKVAYDPKISSIFVRKIVTCESRQISSIRFSNIVTLPQTLGLWLEMMLSAGRLFWPPIVNHSPSERTANDQLLASKGTFSQLHLTTR